MGDEYKDRVTGFPDGHGHSEPPQPTPIRLRRTVPLCRGQNIPLYIYLQSHVTPLPSAHSPTALAGGRWWRQPPKGGAAGMVLADSDISVACQSPESAADAATPYPASPDFPLCRGQNIPLYICLQSHVTPLPSAHSPTALAGGRWWRQPPKGGAAGMVLADSDISVACQSPESAADHGQPTKRKALLWAG